MSLRHAVYMYRDALKRAGWRQTFRLTGEFLLRSPGGQQLCMRLAGRAAQSVDFSAELPPGLPARRVDVRISIPPLPRWPVYQFTEHPLDDNGEAGAQVLATARGGFAISNDLGETWRRVRPEGFGRHEFLHVKALGKSEYLAQAVLPAWKLKTRLIDLLVLNEDGEVLAAKRIVGSPWHGCRAVDLHGDTLMFAEYPYEPFGETPKTRPPRRVFRSRDRGRSWAIVFQQPGEAVRHFHFLQARPGRTGEWWLTSGDWAAESRVWVSKDDGDSWGEISGDDPQRVDIGGETYTRCVYRLTDIAWCEGDSILWGTDHIFPARGDGPRGARILESEAGDLLTPHLVGTALWPIRNVIPVGEFFLFISQGPLNFAATGDARRPNVFLLPQDRKPSARPLVHLFNVEAYSSAPTGFTYSRASRAARGGVFFTSRSATDVFPFGHRLLKWEVRFS